MYIIYLYILSIYLFIRYFIFIFIYMYGFQKLDACFPIPLDPSHRGHSRSCQVWWKPHHGWWEDPYGHGLPEGVSNGQSKIVGLAWFVGWAKCIDHPLWHISVTYMCEWNLSRLKGQSNSLWFAMVITGMDCACHWMQNKKASCFTNLSEFRTSLHFWKRFRGDQALGGSFHRGLLPWRAGFLTWMLWYYDFLHWMFPK